MRKQHHKGYLNMASLESINISEFYFALPILIPIFLPMYATEFIGIINITPTSTALNIGDDSLLHCSLGWDFVANERT
jgi:hypothetical protein